MLGMEVHGPDALGGVFSMSVEIPVFQPWLDAAEYDAATEALKLGWLGMGSYVGEFEEAIRRLVGAEDRFVAAVSTGHAALHIALMLVDAKPGDEIITPSFNNIADFQAILATGASPVFCDARDDDLCIDLDEAEALITPATKAIIVMDFNCHLCDHDRVAEIQKKHGVRIIHDAAHSIGSKYNGRHIGSFSDITMFSFDPVKTITSIDGGALVVRSADDLQKVHEMRLMGMKQAAKVMYGNQRAWNYDVERLGFRYHLANLHAAIGLAQIRKFDAISKSRRYLFRRYEEAFRSLPGLRTPNIDIGMNVPFMYYLRVLDDRRDEFREFLKQNGVDTGIHWQPGHKFKLFKNCRSGKLTTTDEFSREIVTIPFHSNMPIESSQRVIDVVRGFFKN
jgi:dTDP-4-amino-4,6-dideoxygalactose transaminase